jgi:Fe-S-cluster containining protein
VTGDPAGWGAESRDLFSRAREPAELAKAVVIFHRRVDQILDASVQAHAVPIACRRGCDYCCHLRLTVQPYEAFVLAAWLRRNFSAERLAAVMLRLRDNARLTRAMGIEARKRTNMRCSLLGEDGACTAYEARPAQCRRYHSMRVLTCETFFRDPTDESVESPLHPALAHNAAVLITQAQNAARAAELDAEGEDLNLALLEALENPKAWRRWRDGKKPFPAGR